MSAGSLPLAGGGASGNCGALDRRNLTRQRAELATSSRHASAVAGVLFLEKNLLRGALLHFLNTFLTSPGCHASMD
jgi:hypothetical protein